jgi:hypothetical protein|tara:strand:+ start:6421 stop:6648 length:228 start_codon:yes stop_codon:yes gene_type:complete
MFEKLKFPILITFHIEFKVSTKKKGMSSLELNKKFELRQQTYWTFKQKSQEVINSILKRKLTRIANGDTFVIGVS